MMGFYTITNHTHFFMIPCLVFSELDLDGDDGVVLFIEFVWGFWTIGIA